MRKINGSSKSNTHAFVEHRHLFVEKRDDDDDEHKHGDIENIGKRENIQLGTVITKWGLVRCSKRIIRIIIIAIVTMIIFCSLVMSLQGDLNEVSNSITSSSSGLVHDDQNRLRQLLGKRPIVILKLARSGSTWIGDKITETSPYHRVQNEVTNLFKGQDVTDLTICNEVVQHVLGTLRKENGITINPHKFGLNKKLRGTNYSCWDKISKSLRKEEPFVLVWRRLNVVSQTASKLISEEIQRDGICPDAWHLEDCQEGREHKISVQPAVFLYCVRDFQQQNMNLYKYAKQIGASGSIYELTFEDLLAAGDDHELSNRPLDLIPREVSPRDDITLTKALPFGRSMQQGEPFLKNRIVNFLAVKKYFMEHAPDLVEQLMENHR